MLSHLIFAMAIWCIYHWLLHLPEEEPKTEEIAPWSKFQLVSDGTSVFNASAQALVTSSFHREKICFRNSWLGVLRKIFEEGQGSAIVCEPGSTVLTFAGPAHSRWHKLSYVRMNSPQLLIIKGLLGTQLCSKHFKWIGTLILPTTSWSRYHHPKFIGVKTEAQSGEWNLPQSVAQLASELFGGVVTSVPLLLVAFVLPQLLLVSCIIYWALTVCLVLLEMGALRADSDGSHIGRRNWYLGLSCQNLAIPDTWPAQRCRARMRPVRAWGNRGGDLYLSARFEIHPELHCVGFEGHQEGIRGEEKQVFSL